MARKKVVLYNPTAVFFDMPLALLAIGSALDASKYEVIIIDGRLEENAAERVIAECLDAVCLGITVLTGSPLLDALEITQKTKAAHQNLPIIWGGWHPSLFPLEPMREEAAIDITVQGQGENTFKEIVECLATGQSLHDVAGCSFRDGDQLQRNKARVMADMNELPAANYDLIDVPAYYAKKGRKQFDYISSTGCFFRCTFCADPFVYGRKFSAIEPERMGAELKQHYDKYGFDDVNFQDETFFTYRKRVMAIAASFTDQNIKTTWAGTMRADQGHRLSEEDFAYLAASGLRRVLVGVESGSQEMMDWLKKDIKMEYVMETAERCQRHGIGVIFPFIVGFPGETDESIQASLKTARHLRSMSTNFTTPIFYFKPYPGSQITADVVAQGYKLPTTLEEWGKFDYIGSSGPWVSDEKYKLIERFKFYNKLAGHASRWYSTPLKWTAQWRVKKHFYAMPVEKRITEWLRPEEELS